MSSAVAAVLELRTWQALWILEQLTYRAEDRADEDAEALIQSGLIVRGSVVLGAEHWGTLRDMLVELAETEGDRVGPAIRILADTEQFGIYAELAEKELGDERKRLAALTYLQANDSNGVYDDEHSVAEGLPLLSLEDAQKAMRVLKAGG